MTYEGQWEKGVRHGPGHLRYSTKAEYIGEFVQGKKHGKGKFIYPSGNYYDGNWTNDKKNGEGTMFWVAANEKYIGSWKDNFQDGHGTHYWMVENYSELVLMSNKYEGQWQKGKRHGVGAFNYSNGSKYEGEWFENLKHGLGKYTDESGVVYYAIYHENKIKKTLFGLPVQFNTDYRVNPNATASPESGLSSVLGMRTDLSITDRDPLKRQQIKGQVNNASRLQSAALSRGTSAALSRGTNAALGNSKLKKSEKNDQVIVEEPKQVPTEKNPYLTLINIQKILGSRFSQEEIDRTQKEINFAYKVLVRHNSSLKTAFYHLRGIRQCHTDHIFVPKLGLLWECFMKMGCFEPDCGMAAVNRLFNSEESNHFQSEFDPIEFVKKAQEMGFDLQDNRVDLSTPKKQEKKVVHDPSMLIFFKSFIDFLLRIVCLKAKTCKEFSRVLQEFMMRNFLECEEIEQDLDLSFLRETPSEIKELFYAIGNPKYKSRFGCIDETAFVRDLIIALKKKNAFSEEKLTRSLCSIWTSLEGTRKLTKEMIDYEFTIHEFQIFFPNYLEKVKESQASKGKETRFSKERETRA